MSRHLQDVMSPMGWRTGPHSNVVEYGTRAGAHDYVRCTYHHGYVAHHHTKDCISRWIPWIHDVVHRMSGPRHHPKSSDTRWVHGSMMWSTALGDGYMSCMCHTPKGNHVGRHGYVSLRGHTCEPMAHHDQEHTSSTSDPGTSRPSVGEKYTMVSRSMITVIMWMC